MYVPEHFAETQTEVLLDFIRAHPLATVVVNDHEGLSADHLPLILQASESSGRRLLGHIARANPLGQKAREGIDCLAVFHGVQRYISPTWYASKAQTGRVVPTWNYEVVHVRGRLHSVDDPQWLRSLLTQLTSEHESRESSSWRMDEAPPDYVDRLIRTVLGVRIDIIHITGKTKLSQNQPEGNQESLIEALRAKGDPASCSLAQAITDRRALEKQRSPTRLSGGASPPPLGQEPPNP